VEIDALAHRRVFGDGFELGDDRLWSLAVD
jgi:hypothetical protein